MEIYWGITVASLMTNFVGLVCGWGNGRAFAGASTGRVSGTRTAWLEDAMMNLSFRQKENLDASRGEKTEL